MSEVLKYLIFGCFALIVLLVGMIKNSTVLCYASAVLLGPWLFGLIIGLAVSLKDHVSKNPQRRGRN